MVSAAITISTAGITIMDYAGAMRTAWRKSVRILPKRSGEKAGEERIMFENQLIIAATDGNGRIIASQPYDEFLSGRKNLEILSYYTGEKLFDILYDDLGIVRYENNKLAIKIVYQMNPVQTTMTLLGKIAEAVIVRRCHENEEINKRWLSIARRKKARYKTAARFKAVGTGLKSTRNLYPALYNPFDTQRDVIWVDNEEMRAMIRTSSVSGLEAGLQLKVSRNGKGYFFQDLCNLRYEVPVVYFDIAHDYDVVARELLLDQYARGITGSNIILEENFVRASAIDYGGYEEVCFYEDLVMALVTGKMTIDDLLVHRDVENNPTFKNALITATLSQLPINNIIA